MRSAGPRRRQTHLGVWRAKVPVPQNKPRPKHVPAKLLMSVFERLGETEGVAAPTKMRFVLALLLHAAQAPARRRPCARRRACRCGT